MFDSFRDSARIAQTKKDSEGVTAKRRSSRFSPQPSSSWFN
jgi:hypothetical protein